MNKKTLAMLMATLAQIIYGFSFLFTKIGLRYTSPLTLLAVRFNVALLVLTILVLTGKMKVNLRGRSLKWVIIMSLLQPVIYFFGETYGIDYSTSSFSGVMIALIPVISLAFGVLFLKEKVTVRQLLFGLMSVGGVIMIVLLSENSGSFSWFGFFMLLVAVFCGSLYKVVGRKIADEFTAVERSYVNIAMGSIVFTAVALINGAGDFRGEILAPLTVPAFWMSIAYLAVISSVGAFTMINYSLSYLSVSQTAVVGNLTTVVSTVAGVLILHEEFSLLHFVAILVILVGILGANMSAAKEE